MNAINTLNSVIYSVNSDLDDGILYAEFETKEAAIEYAKRNLDKLPFVDELQVTRDDAGEIEDVLKYTTIWDHSMTENFDQESKDDYWDDLASMYDNSEKHDLGDTTWFESMDNLVETLEDNEDEVECKECFDLFPKADCIKVDFGYICPTCAEGGTVSEEDLFKMDFPEYEKMSVGNDMIPDEPLIPTESSEEVPPVEAEDEIDPISTPEEAVPFLVKDEEEAIAGYEKAAEVVADSDLENKDEILEVIDHIKEEEEEHIEELLELVDTKEEEVFEDENDPVSEEEIEDTEDSDEEGQTFEALEESAALAGIAATAASGILVDVVRRIFDKFGAGKKKSKWIDFRKHVIEKTPEGQINIWNHNSEQVASDLKTVAAAKEKIKELNKKAKDELKAAKKKPTNKSFAGKGTDPVTESDQELEGTDNAVEKCETNPVVTHSKDELPLDSCDHEKLTEATTDELSEIFRLCKKLGLKTGGDLNNFVKEKVQPGENLLNVLRACCESSTSGEGIELTDIR